MKNVSFILQKKTKQTFWPTQHKEESITDCKYQIENKHVKEKKN